MLFNKIQGNTYPTQAAFQGVNRLPSIARPQKKAVQKVDIPTVLPPGGFPSEENTGVAGNKKNRFPLVGEAAGKVKNYLKRLGWAFVGIDNQSKSPNDRVTANMLSTSSEEARTSINEDDPMVGRWPLGFSQPNANVPLPVASNVPAQNDSRFQASSNSGANSQPTNQEFDTESFSEKQTSNNDFADIMSQLNSSKGNQEAIMELMKGGSGGLTQDDGGGLF